MFDAEYLPKAPHLEAVTQGLETWYEISKTQPDSLRYFMKNAQKTSFKLRRVLESIFGHSPYLTQLALSHPEVIRTTIEEGVIAAWSQIICELERLHPLSMDTKMLSPCLRSLKRKAALTLGLAYISRSWTMFEVTSAQSLFAEQVVQVTLKHLLGQGIQEQRLHVPDRTSPEVDSGLFILGLGKLGSWELNYSSDIDLIVLYDEEVSCVAAWEDMATVFIRLTQNLVRLLSEHTTDGYVFRVDLRLRPDPGAMPVALSVSAAENYYASVGQNWERAALIKARPIAGDKVAAAKFMDFLQRFIWRKSLDFATIQDIHSIKRQIHAHKKHHQIRLYGHNVKIGRGGIREIEFFAQTQQLIFGGRDPLQRSRATHEALTHLAAEKYIRQDTSQALKDAYVFLRRVEDYLQMFQDEQTHVLPQTEEQLQQLATFLGYKDDQVFCNHLETTFKTVELHYAQLFEEEPVLSNPGNLVFTGPDPDPETVQTLLHLGFVNPEGVIATISSWHRGRYRAMRSARARELLTELVPSLLRSFSETHYPDSTFQNFDTFLAALPSGVQLFSLFYTNPKLLHLVAEIMGTAPYLATTVSHHPFLFDCLLSDDFLTTLPDIQTLQQSLERRLIDVKNLEDLILLLQDWKNEHTFRAGVHILRHLSDIDTCGRYLSNVAEIVLTCLLAQVQKDFAKTYGILEGSEIILLLQGKLGSRQLTTNSDLDVVLIYDVPAHITVSDGVKPLSPFTYFTRLNQRFLNALHSKTQHGYLYNIDTRLRPSGDAGTLAVSLEAFERYQQQDAWVWEHMALTRARLLGEKNRLHQRLKEILHRIFIQPRKEQVLLLEVVRMHRRVQKHFKTQNIWNVKYTLGGMVDIDFLVHYFLLRYATEDGVVFCEGYEQSIRSLKCVKVLEGEVIDDLQSTHRFLRSIQQYLRIIYTQGILPTDEKPGTGVIRGLAYIVLQKEEAPFEEIEQNIKKMLDRTRRYMDKYLLHQGVEMKKA